MFFSFCLFMLGMVRRRRWTHEPSGSCRLTKPAIVFCNCVCVYSVNQRTWLTDVLHDRNGPANAIRLNCVLHCPTLSTKLQNAISCTRICFPHSWHEISDSFILIICLQLIGALFVLIFWFFFLLRQSSLVLLFRVMSENERRQ